MSLAQPRSDSYPENISDGLWLQHGRRRRQVAVGQAEPHGDLRDDQRHLQSGTLHGSRAAHGEQLHRFGAVRLLQRHPLPPRNPGLHEPVRLPVRQGPGQPRRWHRRPLRTARSKTSRPARPRSASTAATSWTRTSRATRTRPARSAWRTPVRRIQAARSSSSTSLTTPTSIGSAAGLRSTPYSGASPKAWTCASQSRSAPTNNDNPSTPIMMKSITIAGA